LTLKAICGDGILEREIREYLQINAPAVTDQSVVRSRLHRTNPAVAAG